jgi:hypothetical protein
VGTTITYIGYFMMILTIIMALFARNSRFGQLVKATKKGVVSMLAIFLLSGLGSSFAQGNTQVGPINQLDKNEVQEFGKLWVHSSEGRFMPVNTLALDIVKKISGNNKLDGMQPEEFWLRALMNPVYWEQQRIFKVETPELAVLLGLNSTKVPFSAFFKNGEYMLNGMVNDAYAKKPNVRNGTDKAIIKLDEKVNVFYMAMNGSIYKMFPLEDDANNAWVIPQQFKRLQN